MKNSQKNKLKDSILDFLLTANNHSSTIGHISDGLKIEYNLCVVLCDDLITKQFVDNLSVATIGSKKKDKILTLSPRGRNFISEGGYRSAAKSQLWKKLISLILPVIAASISIIGLVTSLVNQSDQNSKWAALNIPDVEINDMKTLPFRRINKMQFDSIKFDYTPTEVMFGDTILIFDVLCAIDSATNKILISSFSYNQIVQYLKTNNLKAYICRNFRPSFLFQNLGPIPARNLVIKAEAKIVGTEWLSLNSNAPTNKLTNNMRTAVFGNFFIQFKSDPPDSINFRIHLQYFDQFGKEYLDTVRSRWQASDNQFYNTSYGE